MTWGILRLGGHRTGKVMSWQGIAMFLALTIGGPVGAVVMERLGFLTIASMTIVLPLCGLAIALMVPAAFGAAGQRVPFYRVIGLIWRHGLALSLATIPYASLIAFITLYFHANNWPNVGFALAGFGGGYIVVRLFLAHLPDRIGGLKVAAISLGIEALGQVVLWLAPDPMIALLGATLTGVGFSLVFPSLGVEAVKRVAPQSRGMAVAGFVAFLDVSLGLSGPLMGLVISIGGYGPVFLGGAVAALAALAVAAAMARTKAV
jgi:predicted MFS family arabinose efflux permease